MTTFATTPSLRTLIEGGVELFSGQIGDLTEQDWGRRTPCSEWTIADVADHVVLTAEGARARVTGGVAEEGRPTEDGILTRWSRASDALLATVAGATLDLRWPLPQTSKDAKLRFYACDFAIHSWDVSVGRGREAELPAAWLDFMNAFFRSLPNEALRKPRAFADPLDPRPGDGPTRTLMAYLGRSGSGQSAG